MRDYALVFLVAFWISFPILLYFPAPRRKRTEPPAPAPVPIVQPEPESDREDRL